MPATSPNALPARETASFGRRLLALVIDWFACYFLVALFMGGVDQVAGSPAASFYILGAFVLESWLFTVLLGGSFGKLVTRLRVVRYDGRGGLDPLRALLRAVLVALVIPAVVFRPDGRGLHDMATGSMTVPL